MKLLESKLADLKKEHKPASAKNCNHCVLIHKKSKIVLNLFIGDLAEYFNELENSPFANLYLLNEKDLETKEDYSGFSLTFNQSLNPAHINDPKMIFHLPFLSITRDTGFFKDNIIVHSAESQTHNFFNSFENPSFDPKQPLVSSFQPLMKANKDFILQLDGFFWNYFLSTEQKCKKHNSTPQRIKFNGGISSVASPIKGLIIGRPSSLGNEEEHDSVYVLFLRRKQMRRRLRRELEKDGHQKAFRNFTALLIKEIHISFSSVDVLISLMNVSFIILVLRLTFFLYRLPMHFH